MVDLRSETLSVMAEFIGFSFRCWLKKPASYLDNWRGWRFGLLPIGNNPKVYRRVLPTEGCRRT
jgi:hypothetical protein